VTPSGSLVKYYSAGGFSLGLNTATSASGISYLADDGLGSVTEALNSSGAATGSVLYGPYGGVRYTSGTMPTSKGFTGQYSDAATGLDYYGARYYDPVLGQFTSADPAGDGLNHYAYVRDNPETLTDPTGLVTGGICGGGSAGLAVGVFVDVCFVVGWSDDSGWSLGFTETGGTGGYAGVGAGAGVGLQVSNAHSVNDLKGPFGYAGGGGTVVIPTDPPIPIGVEGTGFGGSDSRGRPVVGAELQAGTPGDIHLDGGVSNTSAQSIDQATATQWVRDRAYDGWQWLQDHNPTPIPIPNFFGNTGHVARAESERAVAVSPDMPQLLRVQEHKSTINYARAWRTFNSTWRRQLSAAIRYRSLVQGIFRQISRLWR
jgi:RHS repeat-associated protein